MKTYRRGFSLIIIQRRAILLNCWHVDEHVFVSVHSSFFVLVTGASLLRLCAPTTACPHLIFPVSVLHLHFFIPLHFLILVNCSSDKHLKSCLEQADTIKKIVTPGNVLEVELHLGHLCS